VNVTPIGEVRKLSGGIWPKNAGPWADFVIIFPTDLPSGKVVGIWYGEKLFDRFNNPIPVDNEYPYRVAFRNCNLERFGGNLPETLQLGIEPSDAAD